MSYETMVIIKETIKEMIAVGLSERFIKKEIAAMFEISVDEDLWSELKS